MCKSLLATAKLIYFFKMQEKWENYYKNFNIY
jgi:hypothetical protein